MSTVRIGAVLAAIVIGACREPTTPPAAATGVSFSLASQPVCPTGANFIVTDEASLLEALRVANPGAVIALNGSIAVSADVIVTTPNITLTCATPASGLRVASGATVGALLIVLAPFVTVDRLTLDGTGPLQEPYFAINDPDDIDGDGLTGSAVNIRFTNNTVRCGADGFVFLIGVLRAIITDNRFTSDGSFTGVQLQGLQEGLHGGIDGTRVERNMIVALAPSTGSGFGAIRVRDGSNVVVADNVVRGPWDNSIATVNLSGGRFENNRLEGARVDGIRFSIGGSSLPIAMINNVFVDNRVSGAGRAGIFAHAACRNIFVRNDLSGNAGDVGAIFDETTGANVLVVPRDNTSIVIDNGGGFDCDGDGVGDPNIITGPGRVVRGVTLNQPSDIAAASSSRLR